MSTAAAAPNSHEGPNGFQRHEPHDNTHEEEHSDHHEEQASKQTKSQRIPKDYKDLLYEWNRAAYVYQGSAYALSLFGIVSGIGVTYFLGGGNKFQYATAFATGLGFLGAVCAAVSGVMRPMQIGNRYRNAWRTLNVARLRFQLDPLMSPMHLWEAMARGELIIGDFELNAAEGRTAPEDRPRNRKIKLSIKLFESFLEWHRDTPKETLLQLLSGQPDFGTMKDLSQPALLILFAQRSAAAAAMVAMNSDSHR
ncbi:hypothetical protein LMG27952_07694 [Paraburkholderia hiiakae]|uniref:SMODS and SLOG-associating 2TM effector domain-containing protein n=2 Tax=Paraburkholderia hiiakae TaxID=1081782 RepID=A0ABM8PBQ8_9BURK|nr:hypothetical protein LMG27952_07694 [Paraburkholderia hiiakae]